MSGLRKLSQRELSEEARRYQRPEANAVAMETGDKLREVVSVQDWGARPDNRDCSAAVQRAFNEAPLGCNLLFPAPPTPDFEYRCASPVTMSRKLSLTGWGARLVFRFASDSGDVGLHVNPTDPFDLDARNWSIEGFREIAMYSGGGDALRVSNDGANVAQIGWVIRECLISAVKGYGIRLDDDENAGNHLAQIVECQIGNGIYHAAADAITIERCNIFGERPSITLDITPGAYQTRILNNTLVGRDGALLVKNADQVLFAGNHCEQFAASGPNQSPLKAQVAIDGQSAARPCRDIFLIHNSFGGGDNCEAPIVLAGHVRDVQIAGNVLRVGRLNGTNKDIRILADTVKGTRIEDDNVARGSRANPEVGAPLFVEDEGSATKGVWKYPTLTDGWTTPTSPADFRFRATVNRRVEFSGLLQPGATAVGTVIFTLPIGFRPRSSATVACLDVDNLSTCYLRVAANGDVTVASVTAGKISLDGITLPIVERDVVETGIV